MDKLKKILSVFLTLVMLFTTLCFFVIPETDITANAASTATYPNNEYFVGSGNTFFTEFGVASRLSAAAASTTKGDLTDNGYTVLDIDLNKDAGGYKIYMGYKTGTSVSTAIRAIGFYKGSNPPEKVNYNGAVYNRVDKAWHRGKATSAINLNGDSGGSETYLYYSTDPNAGAPMTNIDWENSDDPFTGNDSGNICKTPGVWINGDSAGKMADLNEGAGGDYVSLFYHQAATKVSTADMHAAINNAETYISNSSKYVSVSDLQAKVDAAKTIANDFNDDGISQTYTQTSIDNAKNAINNAINALQTSVYFNANGGTLTTIASATVTIGANDNVNFSVESYYATRPGYDFVGWAKSSTAASGSTTTVNVGFNETLYAIWTPAKFNVIFDNLINFSEWNTTTASNAVISNVGDGGFTLTSNNGVGEGTSTSPFFPVKPGHKYKIDIEFEGAAWDVYIFFCDANGTWIDFADGPTNRYSSNGGTGISKDNAVFTAPNKDSVVKAQIRVDANGSNNSVTFKKIRVYEAGTVDGVSYAAPITVTYNGTYPELPVPVRAGYTFDGWFDGDKQYNAGDKVEITSDLSLTSKWTAQPFTVTWITEYGKNAEDKTITVTFPCDSPIIVPSTVPEMSMGYAFAGWGDYPATMPADNIVINTTWKYQDYSISYNLSGGTMSGTPVSSYNLGDTFYLPFDELTRVGYKFDGWTVSTGDHNWKTTYKDKNEELSKLHGNVELTANWKPINYYVTYDLNGGNMAASTERIYDIEDSFELPQNVAKTGHVFVGWKVTSNTGNWSGTFEPGASISEKYGDVTLTAVWAPEKYNVTWVNWDDTELQKDVDVPYGTTPEYRGETPTKPADERNTYVFTGWYPEVSAVTGHAVYKAQFDSVVKTFTVTFNYTTAAGSQTITRTAEYGTEVVKIIPVEYTMGYYTEEYVNGFNHRHYLPLTNITVDTITKNESFTATYVLSNETELFERADDYKAATCEEPGLDSRICSSCGYSHRQKTDATGHSHDSGIVTKEATCFEDGVITYTCHCGDIFTEVIPQLKHSFIYYAEKTPTCTEQGWDAHYYCENCKLCYRTDDVNAGEDNAFEPYKPITAHTPDENAPATCETPQLCKVCSQVVVKALGHDTYIEYEYDASSGISCITPGEYTIVTKCRRCTIETRVGKEGTLDHTFEYTKTVAPTCTEEGYDIYTCSSCTVTTEQRNLVDATGHTEGEWTVTTESTCTELGEKKLFCTVCDELLATDIVDYLDHTCEWVTVEPDCTTAGSKQYICTVCGYVDMSERLPSLGHKSSGLATCETDSKCTVCGEILQKALGHTWDNGKVTKEPTETETGIMEYTCYRDANHKKTEDIPVRVVIELPVIPEDGTYDLDADASGYAGNINDIVKVEEGIPYTVLVDNNAVLSINPNGDIYVAGDGNTVITVITNDGKYHKSFVVTARTVKTVTFDVNGVLSYTTAYAGDSFEAVEVNDFRDTQTGFLKVFIGWTVNGVVITELICTGDMYLVAQFTAPCDYDEIDELTAKFNDVISGAYDNAALLENNAVAVNRAAALIEEFAAGRDTRDSSNQYLVDSAEKQIAAAIARVYPEKGASLEIRGKTECTAGTYVEITAYLMPIDVELADCIWSTSDKTVGFMSEGKFNAVRPGEVTLNAAKGSLTAATTISVKGTTGARVIFFDSLITGAQYILEGAYIVTETTNVFWAPDRDVRFRVVTDHSYDEFIVYVNDVKMTPAADGLYTIPANTGDAHVRMIGYEADEVPDENEEPAKLSFWDMIRNFFKQIGDFFRNLFGG